MSNIGKFEQARAKTYNKVHINELINFDQRPQGPVKQ